MLMVVTTPTSPWRLLWSVLDPIFKGYSDIHKELCAEAVFQLSKVIAGEDISHDIVDEQPPQR